MRGIVVGWSISEYDNSMAAKKKKVKARTTHPDTSNTADGKYRRATHKQEMYARNRIYGQLPPTDALIKAYGIPKFKDGKPKPGWMAIKTAERVEGSPIVQALMTRLKDEAQVYENMTLGAAVYELNQLKELAVQDKKYTAAIRAVELKLRMCGLLVDKHQHLHEHTLTDEEAKRQIQDMVMRNPGLLPQLTQEQRDLLGTIQVQGQRPSVPVLPGTEAQEVEIPEPGAFLDEPPPLPAAPPSQRLQPSISP